MLKLDGCLRLGVDRQNNSVIFQTNRCLIVSVGVNIKVHQLLSTFYIEIKIARNDFRDVTLH